MNYEKILEHQPMLNPNIRLIIGQLLDGTMTKSKLQSRKAYAKRTNNLLAVLEFSIATDILNMYEWRKA